MAPPTFPPYDAAAPDDDPEEKALAMKAVQSVIDRYLFIAKHNNIRGFDMAVMDGLLLIDAYGNPGDLKANRPPTSHPSALFELDALQAYMNLNNVMHGGAVATIFDMTTMLCLAPIQRKGYWEFMGGVSRSINLSYLKGVPAGIKLRIRCWAMQHGRTTALIRGQMESVDGKIVYATCEHHKVNIPTLPEHVSLGLLMEAKTKEEAEKSRL